MIELKFKTNINCGGCIEKVTPYLDQLEGLKWSVDVESKDKILTVSNDSHSSTQIVDVVTESGFKIEPIKKKRFGLF